MFFKCLHVCVGKETYKQIKLSKYLEWLKLGDGDMGVYCTVLSTVMSVGNFPQYKSPLNP